MNFYELIEGVNFTDNVVGQRGRSLDRSVYKSDAWTDYIDQYTNDPLHPFIETRPNFLPEPDYTLYNPDLEEFENKPILYTFRKSVIVVNEGFKEIISRYILSPYVINNQIIKHRSDIYNYWIFHFYHHNFHLIDFSNSLFYKSNCLVNLPDVNNRDFFRYKNLNEFKQDVCSSKAYCYKGKDSHFILPQELKINNKNPYAIFNLSYVTANYVNGLIINQEMYDLLSSMDLHGISLIKSKIIS